MHWPANRSALHLVGQVSPTPQQQAQSSGQQLGAIVGVGLGVLLGKTLLAGHPILWGIGVGAVGVHYALSHLFGPCNPLFGGGTPADPSVCETQGQIVGGACGTAVGLIVVGLL